MWRAMSTPNCNNGKDRSIGCLGMYKAALYGSLSLSGGGRCNTAERHESSAYRIQPITIV